MKTWLVSPYGDDWVSIVHANTRGQARMKGAAIDLLDFIDMRATRLPKLDGKLITREAMIEAGWPEEIEGYALDVWGYIADCGCEVCKLSIRVEREHNNQ